MKGKDRKGKKEKEGRRYRDGKLCVSLVVFGTTKFVIFWRVRKIANSEY
jgi:hypothetical protein